MARIPYVDTEALPDRAARELILERGNLNVYRILANARKVFTGWMIAGRQHLTSDTFSPRLRELVILRCAHLLDSPYELAQHTSLAPQVGIGEQELAALESGEYWETPGFTDTERVVLDVITEMFTAGDVSDTAFARLHAALGDEGTVEMIMLSSRYAGLALALTVLRVDIDPEARIVVPRADRTGGTSSASREDS
ncbi:carboxymuconolactone decarboxylase family protein [Nocardia terpenica]|uniref:4-carboxy muconolactone decarboxylase n=1 Tax=Nocardia terpenica TaxID=455432 RepID=A0A291RIB3_9NOCA|nr:carboxymuconolactone decarboxylase family protein [Nocardia terpenica]ATL67341.1 4-carboxy muconolactone decarboxylase [Nocardia terpenica]